MDLRHSLIPDELIEEMIQTMPEHKGSGAQEDQNSSKYDYITFMERYMGAGGSSTNGDQQHSSFKEIPSTQGHQQHSTFMEIPSTHGDQQRSPTNGDRKHVDIF